MGKQSIPYSEVKKDLRTGDIILFHGDTFIEEAIQLCERTDWSHVGMVVLPEDVGLTGCSEEVLLWESSPVAYVDYETRKKKSGPHLISLDEILRRMREKSKKRFFAIRFLECERSVEWKERLTSFISARAVLKCNFPEDEELIQEYLLGCFQNKKSPEGSYFCSELIADTYMHLGILTSKYPANSYSPKSFSAEEELLMLNRTFLRGEYLLDYEC